MDKANKRRKYETNPITESSIWNKLLTQEIKLAKFILENIHWSAKATDTVESGLIENYGKSSETPPPPTTTTSSSLSFSSTFSKSFRSGSSVSSSSESDDDYPADLFIYAQDNKDRQIFRCDCGCW